MEAQAIGLTGDCLLFLGPKSEAVAHAPNLKCVQWVSCILSPSLCVVCLGSCVTLPL